jgi:hypothetical protein
MDKVSGVPETLNDVVFTLDPVDTDVWLIGKYI